MRRVEFGGDFSTAVGAMGWLDAVSNGIEQAVAAGNLPRPTGIKLTIQELPEPGDVHDAVLELLG
jgi:hypothetical protein